MMPVVYLAEQLAPPADYVIETMGAPDAVGGVAIDRGRDAHHWAPPAQNRTCGFPAYGSHLGCLTAKRALGHG